MHLKRLEISGFKSFASPLTVDFDRGITAVVGPNGSGKSNVADAVRWVLGEQSAKQLRGSKMEDVIFAGSESRKRVNLAQVTLVLDNEDGHLQSDYTEISMTRKLFRSGESEYKLNGTSCRRKDLVDLLVDSGLGKEAYSMIGQGEVEKILSSKPEERRAMFEDAAGVLKYKSRKQQSEKKLQETMENLDRVEDILHELEQQIEPLEIQASTAKEYIEKKEELTALDVALLAIDIEDKHKKWSVSKQDVETLQERLKTEEKQLASYTDARKEETNKLQNIEQNLESAQTKLLEASERLQQQEGHKKLMDERGTNAYTRLDELDKRITAIESEWKRKKTELDDEDQDLREKTNQLTALDEQWKELTNRASRSKEDLEEEIETLKTTYIDVLNEQAATKNELRYHDEQRKKLRHRLRILDEENKGTDEELKAQDKQHQEAIQRVKALQAKREAANDDEQSLDGEIEQATQKKVDTEDHLYRGYRSRKMRHDSLCTKWSKNTLASFKELKLFFKQRTVRTLTGIVGPIASLVSSDKKFETAIETALAGALQHVVVDTERSGRQAIQYLKNHREGRATFLPLDVMRARTIPEALVQKLQTHDGYLGTAKENVQYEQQLEPVIGNLLGAVIIATDLKAGNQLAQMVNYKNRIVTMDGDVINPGSMTGGGEKRKGMELLGRKREREELREKQTSIEEAIQSLEKRVATEKETLAQLEEKKQEQLLQSETIRLELETAKEQAQKLAQQKERDGAHHSLYIKEREAILQELTDTEEHVERTEEKEQSLVTRVQQLQQSIEQKEALKKEEESSEKDLQERVTEMRIERAKQKEQFESQQQTVKRLQADVKEHQKGLEAAKDERKTLESRLGDLSEGSSTIDDDIQLTSEEKKTEQAKVEDGKAKREQVKQQLQLLEEQVQRYEVRVSEEATKKQDEELCLHRLDIELDHLLNRLQSEYEQSYEAARRDYELSIPVDEARTKVKLLKKAIDELGFVNLGAIDEFERISERHDFLKSQQEDLLVARRTLQEAIREMDEEMTRKFRETFVQIRAQFKETYRKMFGGGEADLELSDPDDLLESGIDIFARPPGKKRQALSLLSGGERALTAIALLFAILNVRPVPFCILDEVEAALDEANVTRFANYLQSFAHQTQFIVITHRKGRMASCDALYGVTMEESGVSRLVSVRLEETEQLEAIVSGD
ncbi:LOW QUALITY PROTEIN: chromosome partition protein Smc [Geomicrobium sp. JCM 19037]|nr:LOW QUALITY PROTEIN: chromosome partition protein Smc [Geomicrobium sp. JCM 19037]